MNTAPKPARYTVQAFAPACQPLLPQVLEGNNARTLIAQAKAAIIGRDGDLEIVCMDNHGSRDEQLARVAGKWIATKHY